MIPIRLEIKNFLPYRTLDPVRFEGIHLACLTGPNGAGKSSLLDAITWALWGEARAKRDDELVHLGQGEMYVQLDFKHEDVIYRVFRQRTAGKKGESRLNFLILHEDGKKTLQNEPGIRQTQEKINRMLRLDYKTFVHSAFLQQGKADAFTTCTPAERKKILSDILGLEQWADYEEIVKERLKTITAQIGVVEERLREIDIELVRRPMLERDRADAAQTHVDAQAALAVAEARLKEVESAPTELRAASSSKSDRERRLREYQREREELLEKIERQQKQIGEYEEIISMRDEIEGGYASLQTARETNEFLSDKLRELRTLDEERHDLLRQLDSARTRLESEADSLRKSIAELTQTTTTDYGAELESIQLEVAALQEKQAQRDLLAEQINTNREDHARLKTLRETLTTEGKAQRERLETLAKTDAATCPLCGQALTEEHRLKMVAELEAEVISKREIYRQNQDSISDLTTRLNDDKIRLEAMEGEIRQLSPLMERAGTLQAQAEAARKAEMRLAEDHDRLQQVEVDLLSNSFALDVRESLAVLEGRRDALGYDETTHDDARQQLETFNRYDQLQTRLTIALESLATLQESVTGAQARVERLQHISAEVEAEMTALDEEIARLTLLTQEYVTRDAEVRTERTRERSAWEKLMNAQQSLKALDAQAARKIELEQRREKGRYDEALYNELKRAFGKNGIPAMMIETAIPELEATANDLLARMTDGRMHLKLNTQREKVTGGVAETLDIEIADELGTRSYELYSGGEAFRINFAIRVALSQMLARRAGAQLRTLFIDEGFGTQDEEGRNKLVEAITAIQEDFDLILVITHIDDLRDSFPVHIMVDKTGSGSRVVVR
ncbi:MAG: SMC family ATPase [bacterium]|nr:SMC family ATPase [bacterium]